MNHQHDSKKNINRYGLHEGLELVGRVDGKGYETFAVVDENDRLLFAIPLALLGAIYTSEFLHGRVRSVVKPTMELMASLPSVVLGFLAALVLAPIVETWISAIILAFALAQLSDLVESRQR